MTESRRYPKIRALRLDALVVAAAWAVLAFWVVALGLHMIRPGTVSPAALLVPLFALVVLAGVHIGMAYRNRCPSCSKSPTAQGFGSTNGDWSSIVVAVLRGKDFSCIHCGTRYTSTPEPKPRNVAPNNSFERTRER